MPPRCPSCNRRLADGCRCPACPGCNQRPASCRCDDLRLALAEADRLEREAASARIAWDVAREHAMVARRAARAAGFYHHEQRALADAARERARALARDIERARSRVETDSTRPRWPVAGEA